jgi:hypothetical protein
LAYDDLVRLTERGNRLTKWSRFAYQLITHVYVIANKSAMGILYIQQKTSSLVLGEGENRLPQAKDVAFRGVTRVVPPQFLNS